MSRSSSFVAGAAVAVLLLGGCGGGPEAPLARETFESVMVELRRAAKQDSAGFEARRAEILKAAGVTDSMLLGFVRAHREDLEYMTGIWEAADRRLNGPPEGDTAADSLARR
jgi:hypothetical protein